MNSNPNSVLDQELTDRLLAYDEALASGTAPSLVGNGEPLELRHRLERGIACVQLLQTLRPRHASDATDDSVTEVIHAAARAPLAVPPAPSCPTYIGRFEIRRALGGGGFGVVYLAYDPTLCREVALKIPRAGVLADPSCLTRFQREARAAAGLDHPNLVSVYEAGQLGPICFIALAYCPGQNLAEWLKQRATPVACAQTAQLLLTLAQAIHYAHQHGVLHRDIKPSNVLLTPVAESDLPSSISTPTDANSGHVWLPEANIGFIPRVTDFGLAKLAAGDLAQTQTGAVLGTPCYMAPEQAEGLTHAATPATDVYALGVILYEVLTGRPPFWAESSMAMLWLVKTSEPLSPCRLRPELPRDLATICLKCLQKDPQKRYVSAEALAEDLRRFLTGLPILARPASWSEQAVKWARRRPALAAALTALLLVTVMGIAGISRQWQQTREVLIDEAAARHRAELAQQQAQTAEHAEALALEKSESALYHHRVVLAHREWLDFNVGRASQLLNECRADLRDWEWGYLRHLCDSDLFTLSGHTAPVVSAAFSPDGRFLVSSAGLWFSSEPAEIKFWDATHGQLLWTGLGHSGPVMAVGISPDGRQVASACVVWGKNSGEIKLWEAATGKLLRTLEGTSGVFGLAYSPDGKWLASAGGDSKVRVWDAASGQQFAVHEEHRASVFGVAFSPDSRLLASASWDGTARLWETATGKPVHVFSDLGDTRSIAFSPDGTRLVTAGYSQAVKIWDVESGQLLRTYSGHVAPVLNASFSPDGHYVASSDNYGSVQVWNAQTGRLFRKIRGHTGSVSCVVFSPEGRRVATAGIDRTVRIWDFTEDQESHLLDRTGPARNVKFSPNGKFFAAAGYRHSSGVRLEKRVRVWSVDDNWLARSWNGHTDWVTCVSFAPNSKVLASGSADKTLRIWDVATGRTEQVLAGHKDMVTAACFSPDGRLLASSSLDKTVRLWEVASGSVHGPILTHTEPVNDVVFSHDGRQMVTVGDHGSIMVWETETGNQLFALTGHKDAVRRAVFSPDGRLLATAGLDRTIRIWNMTKAPETSREIEPLLVLPGPSDTEQISGLAFTPDSRRLASSGRDHAIRFWDVVSGDETLTLRGQNDFVNDLAFSPDGRVLASASSGNIRLWKASGASATPVRRPQASQSIADWHRQQADACETASPREWFGVAYHISRLIEAGVDDWQLRIRRADAASELDRWQQAIDDCSRSIDLGAKDPWVWLVKAVCELRNGDIQGYRRTCAATLDRFANTNNFEHANNVAWTVVLAPEAVSNLDEPIRLARKAVLAQPTNGPCRSTLGAILFRAGQLEDALANLHEAARLAKEDFPEDCLFLAMTYLQMGKTAEARRWHQKAVQWRTSIAKAKPDETGGPVASRERMAEIDILRREVENLLSADPE